MTTGCLGNAFEAAALNQSDVRRVQDAANQLEASEDLNQDAETKNYSTPSSITTDRLFVEAANISTWLSE